MNFIIIIIIDLDANYEQPGSCHLSPPRNLEAIRRNVKLSDAYGTIAKPSYAYGMILNPSDASGTIVIYIWWDQDNPNND